MSWDDEDFDIPAKSTNAPAASWEDEEDDDSPILESWDIDEDEIARKKKEEADRIAKEKAEIKRKEDEAKLKKQAKLKEIEEFDSLDPEVRKKLLMKAELNADLNNAADLFGGLGVTGDIDDDDFDINAHPRERANKLALEAQQKKPVLTKDTPLEDHPLFQPTNKQEFEKLRKAVGTSLTGLAEDSSLLYASSLAIDLIRDLSQPLSVENLRKVISTLNVVIKDKERQERQARMKKTGGTATGGAGKKKAKPTARPNVGSMKKNEFEDMDAGDFDDLGDDDFM
ncbi:HCR1 [[Candida] subhashii]|uniref:Eukaryotic translation initiation factor 3 subunit J n=1 Tax=[Candida] subhashii TaxID=561895 RepID=A0A8J5QKC1_9ASCO|nr:HCR1 [[Candida] subhashii]KAG7663718.1 HCR1 [[Candida] subhashii]